jgi:hypothetical protein
MDPQAASFLHALATIAITFAGFSALITVLRQTAGERLTRFDTFMMVNYFQIGFALAIGCLFPEVFFYCGAGVEGSWRAASASAAVLGIYLWADSVFSRRGATPIRLNISGYVNRISYLLGFLVLLLNAFGVLIHWEAGVFAAAMTFMLAISGTDYIRGLNVLFREEGPSKAP